MLVCRSNQIKKITSLQGKNTCIGFIHYKYIPQNKRNHWNVERACCLTSLKGSMTLESSLIVPIFLIIMVGSMLFGQMLILKGQMYHGLIEAAKTAAIEEYYCEKKNRDLSTTYIRILQNQYSNQKNNPKIIQVSNLSFAGTKLLNEEDEVEIHMKYNMQISYPFFLKKEIKIEECVYQKAFTGYKPTDFELGNGYAYITKYGSVYHNSLYCSHIMLKISGNSEVQSYLDGKSPYKPCSKCAKNCTGKEEQLFIPKEGDCYHTSLTCSGLTRWIQKVTIWEVGDRKPCSRCAN